MTPIKPKGTIEKLRHLRDALIDLDLSMRHRQSANPDEPWVEVVMDYADLVRKRYSAAINIAETSRPPLPAPPESPDLQARYGKRRGKKLLLPPIEGSNADKHLALLLDWCAQCLGTRKAPGRGRGRLKLTKELLLRSAILKHHRFDTDAINYDPAKQMQLARLLGISQPSVSRIMEGFLGQEPMKKYRQLCRPEALKGFLRRLDDGTGTTEVPYSRPFQPTEKEEREVENP